MKRVSLGQIVLVALLAACAKPAPPPEEPPILLSQPYFEPVLVEWALAYRGDLAAALPFDLATATRAEAIRIIGDGEADALVTSGEPPADWFATPLGAQAMAVVVHSGNPVRDLTLKELKDLFTGQSSSWEDVGGRAIAVQPILPLPGEPIGDAFRAGVLGGAQPWPGALLAPTPAAAVEVVAEQPGALAIVPLPSVSPQVRVVRISGVLPGPSTIDSGAYPLAIELLATAPQEPTSPLRDFLVWIQSRARGSPGL